MVYNLDPMLDKLKAIIKDMEVNGQPAADDPDVRQKMAAFHVEIQALKFNGYRPTDATVCAATRPGPEGSISKLAGSELYIRMAHFAMELLGPYSQCALGEEKGIDNGFWARRALGLSFIHHCGWNVRDHAQ